MNNSIRFDSYAAILRSNLDKTQDGLSKALMRMSSGLKVLSAKDDASGVVLSSKLNVDLHGLDIANNNIQQGLAMLNTAEGGINEAQNILIRLRDLSLKVLNGTCDEDQKRAIEEEAEQLSQEIQRIRLNTKYNGISLFNNTSDNKNASGDNNLINSVLLYLLTGFLNDYLSQALLILPVALLSFVIRLFISGIVNSACCIVVLCNYEILGV